MTCRERLAIREDPFLIAQNYHANKRYATIIFDEPIPSFAMDSSSSRLARPSSDIQNFQDLPGRRRR
jgi:hypothetical protein